MFDAPRRRRRRRLIWPIFLTVVVAVVVIVATSEDDARTTIAYLEDMRTTADDLGRAGSSLEALVADLSRVNRSEFESVVTGVDTALKAAAVVTESEPPTESLTGAAILYRLAVDSWQEGIEGFSTAMLAAADDPADAEAVDDLGTAVVRVRTGDRIYDALLAELEREDVPAPVADMPQVRLLPVDAPVTVLAPAWVEAARSAASGLPLRPSVRIEQVAADPAWVTSAEGSVVVPATETMDITVVVANTGNTGSDPGRLNLTLTPDGGEPVIVNEEVPTIEAAAQTSVVFPELAVVPGGAYTLQAALVPGGTDIYPDDNQQTMAFLVNADTES